jgi:hypothetical protein
MSSFKQKALATSSCSFFFFLFLCRRSRCHLVLRPHHLQAPPIWLGSFFCCFFILCFVVHSAAPNMLRIREHERGAGGEGGKRLHSLFGRVAHRSTWTGQQRAALSHFHPHLKTILCDHPIPSGSSYVRTYNNNNNMLASISTIV